MRRVVLFLVLCLAAIVGAVLLGVWYLSVYQSPGGSLAGVMGQMMGSGYSDGMTRTMPSSVWVVLVVFLGVIVAGAVGAGYYFAYPEIKAAPASLEETKAAPPADAGMNWDVLMRTSKPEERKVIEALAAHNGSYLQKFVVKETGLSKLKTHRIVSRLAERGIVTVERSGNTNEVSLAPWVRGEALKSPTAPVSSSP
jgi:hypothetical protein